MRCGDNIFAPPFPSKEDVMALLERVGTLLRANLNDLMDKAEDPEKLCKQLVLDMENQLLQVKTQVAMGIADQHLLNKRLKEHQDAVTEWKRKAELAVEKQKDDLARAALERSLSNEQQASGYAQQLEDQAAETEMLRGAFTRLERKLEETRMACEMLIAQSRRARATGKSNGSRSAGSLQQKNSTIARLRANVEHQQATNVAQHMLLDTDTVEDRIGAMEREDQIERLLAELKERQPRLNNG